MELPVPYSEVLAPYPVLLNDEYPAVGVVVPYTPRFTFVPVFITTAPHDQRRVLALV